MNKAVKVAVGCVAAIVALIVGVGLAVGGYFAWQHFKTSDGADAEEPLSVVEAEAEQTLKQQLEQAQWQSVEGTLRYPTFMRHSESRVAAVPAVVNIYSWKAVDLCYWEHIGSWALSSASYPVDGCYVSATDRIASVNDKDDANGLYAGQTESGKLFYMKKKVVKESNTGYVTVAVVAYPEDMQEDVQPLLDMIKGW